MSFRVLFVFSAASACAIALACQSIVGLKEPTETADPCTHAAVPDAPLVDDDPNTNLPGQWYAIQNINVINAPDGGAAGYDLDGVCSCQDGGAGFRGGIDSCDSWDSQERQCDLPDGIDNGLRRLLQKQAQLAVPGLNLNSLGLDERAANGQNTIMVYLGKWNGKPNDKEVSVGTLVSQQLVAVDNCEGPVPMLSLDGGLPDVPIGGARWNGCDRWSVAQSLIVVGISPQPAITAGGYVKNGVVVVSGGIQATLAILGNPVSVKSAKSTFTVSGDAIDGTLAGRLDPISVMRGLGAINLTTGSPPLCDTPLFTQVVDTVCNALDIAQSTNNDFTLKKRCDGLSAGVTFHAIKVPAPIRALDPSESKACPSLLPDTTIETVCGNR